MSHPVDQANFEKNDAELPTLNNASSRLDNAKSPYQFAMCILVFIAIGIAFYKGFRLPNSWSTNYFQFSLFDGVFRRSFLGTLLYPLGCYRFSYTVIASIQAAIFGTAVAILAWQGIKAGLGILVALFFLSEAGRFTFNVLGYPEFIMYIAIVCAIALIRSGRYLPAAIIGAVSVLTHEMAIFTTLPLLALACIFVERKVDFRKLLQLLSPAAILFLVQLAWFQTYSDATLGAYLAERVQCGYPLVRTDYLDVMTNKYEARTSLYFSKSQMIFHIPMMALLAMAIGYTLSAQFKSRLLVAAAILIACLAPLLLGLAGWDTNRWLTMAFLNSLIVMIAAKRLGFQQNIFAIPNPIVLAAFVLVAMTLQIDHFEVRPRDLNDAGLKAFKSYMENDIKEIPTR